jgi:anti-sigma factor RsiW
VTKHDPYDDELLARLLAARSATRDPATLTRALARVRTGAASRGALEPVWLAWLGRPITLATAASLLVVSLGAGVWLADRPASGTTATTTGTDLIGSLLTDESGTDTVLGGAGLDSGSTP